jgi:hypothetical protein
MVISDLEENKLEQADGKYRGLLQFLKMMVRKGLLSGIN